MNHLLRDLAPVTDAGWDQLEDEARRQLGSALAARKLVDFSGPHGWEHSATGLGRVETVPKALVEGVTPLRRTPLWRKVAERVLFQPGDITENGDAAEEVFEEDPGDDEAPLIPGSDGSLGIGSLKGMQR